MTKKSPTKFDHIVQLAYWLAYRLHLAWAFLLRPKTEGVWVAVWCGDELLLIQNSYRNTITLPGGGMDTNETALLAAVRELNEEVGIETSGSQLSLFKQYSSTCEFKNDCINVFELQLKEALIVEIDHREVAWFSFCRPEQALNMSLFPALRTYLMDKGRLSASAMTQAQNQSTLE